MSAPAAGPRFADVDTPALLLDRQALEHNISLVQAGADAAGMALRPHAKAHKSARIARMQLQAGAVGLCCAKLGEAEMLAEAGVKDLLVTTPVVGALKVGRLMRLAGRAAVRVVVDDPRNVAELASAAAGAGLVLPVLVEVDVGQHRCGVPDAGRAAALARQVAQAPRLVFAGLQGYQGGVQCLADYGQRRAAVAEAMAALDRAARAVAAAGLPAATLTGGGTGSLPIDLSLGCLSELQPGSYVTMDRAYGAVHWQGEGQGMPLARPLSVLASVVSCPSPQRAIVDVGWKSINSDGMAPACAGRPQWRFEFAGDEHGQVLAEHGELGLAPGDRIELIPGHCDTTVNLYGRFVVHAHGQAQESWPIDARGMSS